MNHPAHYYREFGMSTTYLAEQQGDPYRALTYLLFSFTISYMVFQVIPTLGDQFLPGVIIITSMLSVFFATTRPFERLYVSVGGQILRRHMVAVLPFKPRHSSDSSLRIPSLEKIPLKQRTPLLANFILCYKQEKRRFRRYHISANLALHPDAGKEGLVERGRWIPMKFALKSPYLSKPRNKVIGLWYFCVALVLFLWTTPILLYFPIMFLVIGIGIAALLASCWWFKDSWTLWYFALHLSVFKVKWHEVLQEYSEKVLGGKSKDKARFQFPSDLFRDLHSALREEDLVYAESIIFELDRRYAVIRKGIRREAI